MNHFPYKDIAEFMSKDMMTKTVIYHSESGFQVEVNGKITQKNLDNLEIVRYLANALEGK